MEGPYREKGARPPLREGERRWFTKQGESIKGPYDEDAIVRTVKAGRLRPSTLVRAEDEADWRPYADEPRLAKKPPEPVGAMAPMALPGAADRERVLAPPTGSFGTGFVIGFFGGCIGAILAQVIAKGSETKRGAWMGFITAFVVGMVLRFLFMAASLSR